MTDNEERYRAALEEIKYGAFHQGAHTGMSFKQVYDIADNALNPRPQTEEVVGYRCISCMRLLENQLRDCCDNPQPVKLTGTYTRPIPPKKKRREYVGEAYIELVTLNGILPPRAKIFAEWEEE